MNEKLKEDTSEQEVGQQGIGAIQNRPLPIIPDIDVKSERSISYEIDDDQLMHDCIN